MLTLLIATGYLVISGIVFRRTYVYNVKRNIQDKEDPRDKERQAYNSMVAALIGLFWPLTLAMIASFLWVILPLANYLTRPTKAEQQEVEKAKRKNLEIETAVLSYHLGLTDQKPCQHSYREHDGIGYYRTNKDCPYYLAERKLRKEGKINSNSKILG